MAGWRITWCHLVCAVVPPGRATGAVAGVRCRLQDAGVRGALQEQTIGGLCS